LPGIPPAKEMMSGLEARLMSSLMADERSAETDAENLGIIWSLEINGYSIIRYWAEAQAFICSLFPGLKSGATEENVKIKCPRG
jgi:hypothetical protein